MNWKNINYHPQKNKKLKPIIKFNKGKIAIICNKCGEIIKQKLSFKDFFQRKNKEFLFCPKCALELVMKMFKSEIFIENDSNLVVENSELSN